MRAATAAMGMSEDASRCCNAWSLQLSRPWRLPALHCFPCGVPLPDPSCRGDSVTGCCCIPGSRCLPADCAPARRAESSDWARLKVRWRACSPRRTAEPRWATGLWWLIADKISCSNGCVKGLLDHVRECSYTAACPLVMHTAWHGMMQARRVPHRHCSFTCNH